MEFENYHILLLKNKTNMNNTLAYKLLNHIKTNTMKRFSSTLCYTFIFLFYIILFASCNRKHYAPTTLCSPMFDGGSGSSKTTKGKKAKKSEAATLSSISPAGVKETKTKTSTPKTPRAYYDALGETAYEVAEESILYDSKTSSALSKRSIRLSKSASAGAYASYMPSTPSLPATKAGTLTAGEVNDFTKWEMWKDISSGQLNAFKNQWKIDPKYRYTVQLKNAGFSTPVVDARVQLINKKTKEVLFETRTDNTGKAELWYDLNNLDTIKAKPDPIKTSDTSTLIWNGSTLRDPWDPCPGPEAMYYDPDTSEPFISLRDDTPLLNSQAKESDKKVADNVKLPVKILANGNLDVLVNVSVEFFSTSAKEKIEKLGGKATFL